MHRRIIRGLLLLLTWLFVGSLFDVHAYLNYSMRDIISLKMILFWELPNWMLWAALSIPIYKLAEKFPVQSPVVLRNTLIHLCLSIPVALVHVSGNFFISWSFGNLAGLPYIAFLEMTEGEFFTRLPWRIMVYLVIIMGSHVFIFRRRIQAEQQRSALLQAEVAKAELEALKMQLQPHFLFNTLSTISELIHHERDVADGMVVSLGELLRRTITFSGIQKITLAEELDLLELYLSIQRGRFEDLKVQLKIEDEARRARVPSLILQPLVENAIKYGTASSRNACRIEVSAQLHEAHLLLCVYNDRKGNGHTTSGTGVGLANTQERLRLLYGPDCKFRAENISDRTFAVTIQIPAQLT